jgi:hypothetical protein
VACVPYETCSVSEEAYGQGLCDTCVVCAVCAGEYVDIDRDIMRVVVCEVCHGLRYGELCAGELCGSG